MVHEQNTSYRCGLWLAITTQKPFSLRREVTRFHYVEPSLARLGRSGPAGPVFDSLTWITVFGTPYCTKKMLVFLFSDKVFFDDMSSFSGSGGALGTLDLRGWFISSYGLTVLSRDRSDLPMMARLWPFKVGMLCFVSMYDPYLPLYMDIHIWISIYGYPYMDTHIWISIYGYPYMDIHI